MKYRPFIWLILAAMCAAAQGQRQMVLPPIPPNSNEPISGAVQMLQTPAERAAGLNLLNIAGQDYTFGQQGRPDTAIELSLQSRGNLRFEGTGTMTEVWAGGRRTWWSNFGNETSGIPYNLNSNPVPMRVAMARDAILHPLTGQPTMREIRVAGAAIAGKPVTCVLVTQAAYLPSNAGRDWLEQEYCMDGNGLLRLWSPEPGVYYFYDYSAALQYAGHTIASTVHVIEGQEELLTVQVTRLGAPNSSDLEALRQSPPHIGILADGFGGYWAGFREGAQAVVDILHVTVNPQGQIIESEVIPNGNPVSEQAVLQTLNQIRFLHQAGRYELEYWIRESRP